MGLQHASIWSQIPNADENIKVSCFGVFTHNGKILKVRKDGRVSIRRDGKQRSIDAGRTVLNLFKAELGHGYVVRRLDGDLTNNRLDNLAWRPKAAQRNDPCWEDWYPHGDRNGNWKAEDEKVRKVFDMRAEQMSYKAIAQVLEMSPDWARRVARGDYRKNITPNESFQDKLQILREVESYRKFSRKALAMIMGVGENVIARCIGG